MNLKNYLTIGIIGLGLFGNSCNSNSKDLSMLEKETLSNLKTISLKQEYELVEKSKKYVSLARKELNNSVKDFYVSQVEQEKIKNYMDFADALIKNYDDKNLIKSSKKDLRRKIFSEIDEKYYSALKKNVNLWKVDIGKPELEKLIQKESEYKIKVEKNFSNAEFSLLVLVVFFSILMVKGLNK